MTFYFYDLETSGVSPKSARIMQFAGQRTDMELNPVGEPHNILIKLSEDVLPDPWAILITGITPQKTVAEGITEAEFLKIFHAEIATPDTIFVGFNSVRFDDEFMRYLHYRNFYDPYEWHYQDAKSRWDLLDMVRMTRALRPEGIKWPVDTKGFPTNRLELLASINKLIHTKAHDALSDVEASIALARLIREKQPKLFDFLLSLRDKKEVARLVNAGQPFVYTSGKYDNEFEKTTIVTKLVDHPKKQGALVYDLRHDPQLFAKMEVKDLVAAWQRRHDDPGLRLPVKTLQYNRCPAVAPLGVLDASSWKRLGLTLDKITANRQKLANMGGFIDKLVEALTLMDKEQQVRLLEAEADVDTLLYDQFVDSPKDKQLMREIRTADIDQLKTIQANFKDQRLQTLLPLYKARNFPKALTQEEREIWEKHRVNKLLSGGEKGPLGRFYNALALLSQRGTLSPQESYLLEELKLYAESVVPEAQ